MVPARPGEHYGPAIHTDTGAVVGHGTLSEFRSDDAAVHFEFESRGARVSLHDNFMSIDVDADTPAKASSTALVLADRFVQNLTLAQRRLFQFRPIVFDREDRTTYPVPTLTTLVTVSTYDLSSLQEAVSEAAIYAALDDPQLVSALDYLQLGLLLFTRRSALASPLFRQHGMLISAAFLNVWKALSVIVGDPSTDRDYQSRYRRFGLNSDFFEKMERVRELRNDYDVAHYSLDLEHIDVVERAFSEAVLVAAEAISAYRAQLPREDR